MREIVKRKIKDHIVKFNLKLEYFLFSNEILSCNFQVKYNKFKEEFKLNLEELQDILKSSENLETILEYLKEEQNLNFALQEITKSYITLNFLKIQKKYLDLIVDFISDNFLSKKNGSKDFENIFLFYFEKRAKDSINYKTKKLNLERDKNLNVIKEEEICFKFENDILAFNIIKYMMILSIFFETVKEEQCVMLENYMKTKKELISNIMELHNILKQNNIENFKLIEENKRKIEIIKEKNKDDFKNVLYNIVSIYLEEISKILNIEKEEQLPEDMVIFLKKMLKISKF